MNQILRIVYLPRVEELADLGNKIERVLSYYKRYSLNPDNKACQFYCFKKGDIFEQNLNILPKNAMYT
ncbi:MAG: hypothetical protein ACLRPQ_03540 [Streptococcus sp.]